MMRFELKKILNNKFIVVFLVLFFCLDIFAIINKNIGQINYTSNEQYDNYRRIYNEIRGHITDKKLQILQAAKSDLDTYGLYPENAINTINNNRTYAERAKDVVENAIDNADTYKIIDQKTRYINSIYIANIFSRRCIECYYETDGIDEYLKYDYSTVMVVIIAFMSVNILWTDDRRTEMDKIINTTYYGKNILNVIKTVTVLFITVVSQSLFRILELCIFYHIYKFDGIFQKLYSVPEYADTLYNGSIVSVMAIDLILKILGEIMIALILIICIMCIKNIALAYITAIIINITLRYPVKAFDNYRMFRSRNMYVVQNYLFTDISVMILLGIIPVLLIGGITMLSQCKQIGRK